MTTLSCRCGTGHYCKRHQTYGVRERRRDSRGASRSEVETITRIVNHQAAGGGIRVLRSGLNS